MKSISFQGNKKELKDFFQGILLLLSFVSWGYFLFLWILLGYRWNSSSLEVDFTPLLFLFLKLPLFFKVCCGLVVAWWHLILLRYRKSSRVFYIFLSLVLALGLTGEQFFFILNPVRAYSNTLKADLKAVPASPS